ncbi:MAG: aldo/keto reductase [Trueperaceae bacterium]|nr:aldo/keto reductase [Trueperaceae bacterium]
MPHPSDVPRVELAPGLSISRALTGLWQIADLERGGTPLDPEATADAMAPYADAGLTTFDMADHYGSAELIAGAFRRRRPEGEVQLLTKWVPEPGPVDRATVRDAVDRARARLGVERIDLLQFHTWAYDDPSWMDALFYLQELKEQGVVRALGLTNFDAAHLRLACASGVEIASNQVAYSLLDRRAAGDMVEVCERYGVQLLGYGTVAGGLLTERWVDAPEPVGDALETWSQMKYRRFVDAAGGWSVFQQLLRAVKRVAERHGVSMATVASRYVLEQPSVAGVIIGARLGRSAHVEDTVALFSFDLDDDDRAVLEAALTGLQPIPGDSGDEYRKPPFLTASGDLSHHVAAFPAPFPVRAGAGGRPRVLTGTVWETMAGFARAIRVGDRVLVSGTTATHGMRLVGGDDAEAQTHAAIDKVAGALRSLGASLEDVVRTRLFVKRVADADAVTRAHGRRFGDVQPANTLVQADLIGDGYLVEMEAEAVLPPTPTGRRVPL